jgi:TolA-binding protein
VKLFFLASLAAQILLAASVVAQPRVEEERPLVRAVRSAQVLADNGNHGLAINTLEAALDSVAPGENRSDALYLLARTALAAQRYRTALTASRDFQFEYPDDRRSAELVYVHGIAAYQEGKVAEAEEAFRQAIDDSTRRSSALYWLARISADRRQFDSAEAYADRSVAAPANEFTDDALYLTAWIKEGRRQIDTAATLYRRILDEYPESDLALDAQLRLGVIEAERGHYESAKRLLTSLTPKSERQREEHLFYLAEVNSALGNHDEALAEYNEFLRSFPSSPRARSARYGAGWSELQLKQWDQAIASFRQLEEGIDSIAAASSYQIGAIQTLKGDTASAMKTFQSLLYRLPYESFSDNANFQLGRIFYRRGDYDSARHYLLVAARQFPESDVRPEAYYLLGESYVAMHDYGNAQYAFSRAQKVGATGDLYQRALYREGVMLYRVGRFRSAIDRLREYVSKYPDGPQIADATFWLGEALYQDRTYDEAERYYTAVVDRYSQSQWLQQAVYGLAWSRFQQKDFKGSARAFADFIKVYPTSDLVTEATIRLADSYRFLGEYDKAIRTYQSIGGASSKGERAEEARFRLADVFIQMGDVDRAVETFRSLIRDFPDSPRRDIYAFDIGSLYKEKNRDSLAIAELQSFIAGYRQSELVPQAYFSIGDIYYNVPQYDSALVYYRAVLDSFPNSAIVPEALDAVRFSLEGLGRGREAVAVIDSFMVRNPTRIPADSLGFRKAGILFESGDYDEAIAVYRKLTVDYPESGLYPEALFRMGQSYGYLGRRDSALLLFNDIATRFPESSTAPKALMEAGDLRLRSSEWEQAASGLEQLIERYPESDRINEARYGLGRARLMLGDTASAMLQFRRVLDSTSKESEDVFSDHARLAMARIHWQRKQADSALSLLAPVVSRRLDEIAAESLLLRGEIFLKTNDLSSALAELKRLTTDYKTYPEFTDTGMLMLGTVYEQLTNFTSARDTYSKLIAETASPKIKTEAESRLNRLRRQ